MVSCAYVGSPSAPNFQGFSAGSFKDMTRVARLNEDMWTELFLENREALVREIDTLVEELAAFAYTIRRGDRDNLRSHAAPGPNHQGNHRPGRLMEERK